MHDNRTTNSFCDIVFAICQGFFQWHLLCFASNLLDYVSVERFLQDLSAYLLMYLSLMTTSALRGILPALLQFEIKFE